MFDWIERHPYVAGFLAPAFLVAIFVWESIAVRLANLFDNWRYGKSDRIRKS